MNPAARTALACLAALACSRQKGAPSAPEDPFMASGPRLAQGMGAGRSAALRPEHTAARPDHLQSAVVVQRGLPNVGWRGSA